MDKDIRNIKRDLRKLFRSQPLAVLATQNQGQPYASLVAFASSDDLKSFYFATTRSTRKYAYLSGDSRVAVLVDNRSNSGRRASDPKRARRPFAQPHSICFTAEPLVMRIANHRGILLPIMWPWLKDQGFEAFGMMNRALKKTAEHSCESSF